MLGPDSPLAWAPPANFRSQEWGGQKVLWVLSAAATPPVLVRGRQLDGDSEIRFNDRDVPADELVLDTAIRDSSIAGGWYAFPGYTRLRHGGCYAYQVDDATTTSLIVFRAVE
jgi:hypothetical protein